MRAFIDNKYNVEKVNKTFTEFIDGLQYTYNKQKPSADKEIFDYINSLRLWPNQFAYVHHIKTGRFFHKGFDQCLGYTINELTADFFINILHPADLTMYFKISKALLSFVMDNSDGLIPFDSSFQINYRVRKKDGNYIQVVRQSTPFIKNADGKVEAYISLCSDITSISESNCIKWEISGPRKERFNDYLDEKDEDENLFSGRELDVLKLLSKGYSSAKISEKLFISVNTVNTHRKNLMRKANVNKTIDLLSFALESGYI